MKRITTVFLVLLFSLSFVGCGSMGDEDKLNDVELADIYHEVKESYGENYLPSLSYTQTQISNVLGVEPAMYEDVIAEGPAISAHADTFIAVKAKEGKADAVETALNDYKTKLENDALQYPANQIKIKASKVLKYGNYVFYLLVGEYPPADVEEKGEDAMLDYAKEQIKIGEDAIKKKLGVTS